MFGFRKRRPVQAVPRVSDKDIVVASCWGIRLDEWEALTDFERAECRRTVTVAPRFAA